VAKHLQDWPAWGHRKIAAIARIDGHDIGSMSSVKRAMARRGLLRPVRYQAERRQLAAALRQGRAPDWATGLTNGLAATAARLCPTIGTIRNRLHDAGACHVQVSGSGPTVFALCASETAARRMAAAVGSGREYIVWAVPFHLEILGADR